MEKNGAITDNTPNDVVTPGEKAAAVNSKDHPAIRASAAVARATEDAKK